MRKEKEEEVEIKAVWPLWPFSLNSDKEKKTSKTGNHANNLNSQQQHHDRNVETYYKGFSKSHVVDYLYASVVPNNAPWKPVTLLPRLGLEPSPVPIKLLWRLPMLWCICWHGHNSSNKPEIQCILNSWFDEGDNPWFEKDVTALPLTVDRLYSFH